MDFLDKKSYRDDIGIGYYFGKDLAGIKKAARLQKKIRDILIDSAKPGVTTHKLNTLALKLIKQEGAEPLFQGYGGFPHAICASVNDEVVHGLACKDKLKKGDVLSLDLGVKLDGFCGDSARTIIIGGISKRSTDALIIEVAEKAFFKGLEQAVPGNTIGDIGYAILEVILEPKDKKGHPIFDIYKDFMGHGIGHKLHERPHVFNYGHKGNGHILQPGMCICIEPVIIHRGAAVVRGSDIFTFKSSNGSIASHYENQLYISPDGPIILT